MKKFFLIIVMIVLGGCTTTQKGTGIKPISMSKYRAEERQLEKAGEIKDKDILLLVSKIRNNYKQLIVHHKKAKAQIKKLTAERDKLKAEIDKSKAEKKEFSNRISKILKVETE